MNNSLYSKILVTISVGGLLMLSVIFFYHYDSKIDLSAISLSSKNKLFRENHVRCNLMTNIGQGRILKVEMLIPFENERQRDDLMNNMKRYQSDFITNIDRSKMMQWVKQRDYSELKNEFLKIINQYTKQPVAHLYFDSLICY